MGLRVFRRWRDHDLVKEFHDRLRGQVRNTPGRVAAPTAGVIDSQSIKTSTDVPADLGRRARRRPAHDGVPASSVPRACSEAV
ncbi:hypothetical protein ABZ825_38545 [Streptomyces tauricus]|uniref:hypothetical protein n=1 Tax=Streptomyces tauricus TaxID=68274 RepID=UPI0033F5FEAA